MNTIFVPIDFSAASDWGFYYAYNLAQQLGCKLVVGHLYRPPYIENTMPTDVIRGILLQRENEVMEHLRANAHPPIAQKETVNIEYVLSSGADADIVELANQHKADLIVMGTHGADGSWDKVWGTNTSKVIQTSKCPVLAVPGGAEYNGIKHIAYATDYDGADINNLVQLSLLATALQAQLHCIHIQNVNEEMDKERQQLFQQLFQEKFPDGSVTFSIRSSTSVEDGLETFLRINHIDVLAMLTHKRGFWEKLLGNRSVTRQMALRSKAPLLAFHV